MELASILRIANSNIMIDILSNEKLLRELENIPETFWEDVNTKGIITKEDKIDFEDDYISYMYEPRNGEFIPTLIYHRNKKEKKETNIYKIFKILLNKELVIDFLEYNETYRIIERIMNNEELLKQLEEIPENFWEESIKSKILVYSDYTHTTRNNKIESLDYKYQSFNGIKEHTPALIYQKRKDLY